MDSEKSNLSNNQVHDDNYKHATFVVVYYCCCLSMRLLLLLCGILTNKVHNKETNEQMHGRIPGTSQHSNLERPDERETP